MNFQHINSLQNPLVKHLTKLNNDRKYRETCQTVIIEGEILIRELCKNIPCKTILSINESLIPKGINANHIFIVNEDVLKKISGTLHPEGILAEVSLPVQDTLEKKTHLIALDGIQDPGNLGTLLRTALALGWNGAFLLDGCCDPWNDKAVRSAKGATFKLPLRSGNWEELSALVEKNQLIPLAADMCGDPIETYQNEKNLLLVLGNESKGLSTETLKHCKKVTIPIESQMESLNVSVAGGILMYNLKRSSYGR